jgi:hypothetical protein
MLSPISCIELLAASGALFIKLNYLGNDRRSMLHAPLRSILETNGSGFQTIHNLSTLLKKLVVIGVCEAFNEGEAGN